MQFTEGENLHQAVLSAPIGICILDAITFKAEIVNDKFLEIAGKTREAILGKWYWEPFAEARAYYETALAKVPVTGLPYYADEIELKLIRHGREENIFVTFVYVPVKNSDDEVAKVAVWVLENTKQVKARQAVTDSEKRFRALVTATSDVVYSLSADWEVMRPLDGRGFLKDTQEPITGWRSRNIHPDDMEMVNAAIAESIRGKKIFQLEHRVVKADGAPGWTFSRAVPILDAKGEVVEWFGMASDITERKEMVNAMQQSIVKRKSEERELQLLINMLPASVVVIRGDDLVVEMINQANLDYWNKTEAEVIGNPFLEILPDLSDQPFAGQLRHVMATGEVLDVKESPVVFENPDGSIRETYVDYTYQPLTDNEGKRNGVLVMSFEITDRVLARRQVEQSEENLKAMIEQAPVAMCILTGPGHVITVANELIVALWGKPQADVMDKPIFEALPDARGQGLEEAMKNVYESGETFYASEAPVSLIRHGRPEVVYQNFVYQAYRDATGSIAGIIAITIDVTEQVLARKTIERSAAELSRTKQLLEEELEVSKQVQRQKDDFIGMASHELKTPLTSLKALLQVSALKLKDHKDAFLSSAMDKSNMQVKRMTAMINGFLDISRLEAGKILIEKKLFHLNDLIYEVLEEAKLTAISHQFTFESCGALPVLADRDKLSSVMSNLINNAVKYSAKGTSVKVSCSVNEKEAIVAVKDQGIGIKATDISSIFDRYYRVKNPHTQHIAGFGIGLYLSAEIISRHDGRIWVESEPDQGSTFFFTLPL